MNDQPGRCLEQLGKKLAERAGHDLQSPVCLGQIPTTFEGQSPAIAAMTIVLHHMSDQLAVGVDRRTTKGHSQPIRTAVKFVDKGRRRVKASRPMLLKQNVRIKPQRKDRIDL